jgi:hypothetical protein
LEEVEARYVIVEAFTGLAFGVTRATFDVDILVDLREIADLIVGQPPFPGDHHRV